MSMCDNGRWQYNRNVAYMWRQRLKCIVASRGALAKRYMAGGENNGVMTAIYQWRLCGVYTAARITSKHRLVAKQLK